MKSGTEKNPNPHEVSLSKFLSSLATPVSLGYVAFKKWADYKRGYLEKLESRIVRKSARSEVTTFNRRTNMK